MPDTLTDEKDPKQSGFSHPKSSNADDRSASRSFISCGFRMTTCFARMGISAIETRLREERFHCLPGK